MSLFRSKSLKFFSYLVFFSGGTYFSIIYELVCIILLIYSIRCFIGTFGRLSVNFTISRMKTGYYFTYSFFPSFFPSFFGLDILIKLYYLIWLRGWKFKKKYYQSLANKLSFCSILRTISSFIFLWLIPSSSELWIWCFKSFDFIFVCSSLLFSCENTIVTSSLVGLFDSFTSTLWCPFLSYNGFLYFFILTIEFNFRSKIAISSGLNDF